MQEYPWPSNIRELKNLINRAVLLCQGQWISATDLNLDISFRREEIVELTEEEKERTLLLQTLEKTFNNRSKAAMLLNISRTTLYEKLKKYHIDFEMMQYADKQTVQRSNDDSEKRKTSRFAEVRPNSLFFCLLPPSEKGNGEVMQLAPKYALCSFIYRIRLRNSFYNYLNFNQFSLYLHIFLKHFVFPYKTPYAEKKVKC